MARIRSIKPETWTDEKLASVSRDSRLLFVGLWTAADDEGRLRGHPALVKASVFPYDTDLTPTKVGLLLEELERFAFIQRYEVDGQSYVLVRNFNKHQKIDHASKSQLPAPPPPRETLANPRETVASRRETLAPDQGAGSREGNREQGEEGPAAPDPDLEVYARWRELWSPTAARELTDKRRKIIRARRKERDPACAQQQLLDSLEGWKHDPWAERRNQASLEILLRDAGQVDKGLALLAAGPPRPVALKGGFVPYDETTHYPVELPPEEVAS